MAIRDQSPRPDRAQEKKMGNHRITAAVGISAIALMGTTIPAAYAAPEEPSIEVPGQDQNGQPEAPAPAPEPAPEQTAPEPAPAPEEPAPELPAPAAASEPVQTTAPVSAAEPTPVPTPNAQTPMQMQQMREQSGQAPAAASDLPAVQGAGTDQNTTVTPVVAAPALPASAMQQTTDPVVENSTQKVEQTGAPKHRVIDAGEAGWLGSSQSYAQEIVALAGLLGAGVLAVLGVRTHRRGRHEAIVSGK